MTYQDRYNSERYCQYCGTLADRNNPLYGHYWNGEKVYIHWNCLEEPGYWAAWFKYHNTKIRVVIRPCSTCGEPTKRNGWVQISTCIGCRLAGMRKGYIHKISTPPLAKS